MSRKAFCQACSNLKHGVVTRRHVPHTCGMEESGYPKRKIFTDTIHGFKAEGLSKTMAWMLIRNKCHELNLEVPTMDKIIEV